MRRVKKGIRKVEKLLQVQFKRRGGKIADKFDTETSDSL